MAGTTQVMFASRLINWNLQ